MKKFSLAVTYELKNIGLKNVGFSTVENPTFKDISL
jgi:hypothetical protein